MNTLISFPAYISHLTGVAGVKIGVRKVKVYFPNCTRAEYKRSHFPKVLPEDNDLAFIIAAKVFS